MFSFRRPAVGLLLIWFGTQARVTAQNCAQNPLSKATAHVLRDEKSNPIGVEVTDGKGSSFQIPMKWEWSPDVKLTWVTTSLVILSQNESYNGRYERKSNAWHFGGLVGVVDVPGRILSHLDYLRDMWVNTRGDILVLSNVIGRRGPFSSRIGFVDLLPIRRHERPGSPTYKEQEARNSDDEISKAVLSSRDEVQILEAGDLDVGWKHVEDAKVFLLSPPNFSIQKRQVGLVLGLGLEENRIEQIVFYQRSFDPVWTRTETLEKGSVKLKEADVGWSDNPPYIFVDGHPRRAKGSL